MELWQLVRQGDRAAYEVLYRRYMELLFVEIHKRIRSKTEAEDITQDVFLSLCERRTDLVLEGRLFSYLYKMAQNKVFRYFRDKKIPAGYVEAWETLTEETASLVELPLDFKEADLRDMEFLVETERQKLPLKMREVYELRYEQKMTSQEISEKLVISPNTVRNHLKEVRKRFSSAIKKKSFFLFSLF
jgi:RNA polymerase sigma-70 factor (ECF subfamily)